MKKLTLLLSILLLAALPTLAESVPLTDAAFAAQHLPEYTLLDGNADDEYCSFLMTNPAGETVFVGGVHTADGWVFTESVPLLEGTVMDSYHSGSSSFIFSFPHPEGEKSFWEDDSTAWVTVVAYPQEDGSWQAEAIRHENEEVIDVNWGSFPGYYVNMTGRLYGTVTFERDMRYIDWSAFPLCLDEALACLADDMGVIGKRTLPLYTDAIRTEIIAEYRYATPMAIIARVGDMARVRIADSDVVGWVNAYALLTGAEQLMPDVEDPAWDVTAEYYADWLSVPEGTAYYDAPDGTALGTTEFRTSFILMAQYGDWCHVCWPESMESAWVRTSDGELLIWADNLPVPEGCTLIDGWSGLQTAMHLMEKPDGTVVLACFVRTETDWALTESTPLPAGLSHGLDTFHAGEGGIRLYLALPEERRVYEDCDDLMVGINLQPDGTWTADGVNTGWDVIAFNRHGVYDDGGYPFYGDLPLLRDITQLDWAALPGDFAQAMALVDTSRWAIVTRDGAPVRAGDMPDGSLASPIGLHSILLYALEGTPVTILDRQEGLVRIAFMDSGVTGWIAECDLLPAAEQMVWSEEDEWWDNRHHPLEYILDDETVTRYDALHDEDTATPLEWEHFEYITLLGYCPHECCYLIWREDAGEVLWIGAEGLGEAFIEW